jgi:GDP/UDP-N,N'-diacetylbacillosamine 2-epimerase (hydrolysing)
MKRICVITTGRWDYPYLYWIMKGIESSPKLQLQIICPENHHNRQEIYREFALMSDNQIYGISAINSIADYGQVYADCFGAFDILKPGICLICGDRFETMAAATSALLTGTKICHIHGGETTTGAFDDNIRNSITQMAQYHFVATWQYAENVRRMTESKHIYNTGSPGLDWLKRTKLLSKQELQRYVGVDLNQQFIVACLHPETKNLEQTEESTREFLFALMQLDQQIVLIKPNIDPGNDIIKDYYSQKWISERIHVVDNLDHLVYLSLLQHAEMMIGNSSSGIIESASFDLPSVSVGNRQAGRTRGSNVFDCPCETEAILTAVDRAREWNATVGGCDNPYGRGDSSEKIIKVLEGIE